jgi:hypothetical protein
MKNNLKSAIAQVAVAIAMLLILSSFSSAQETVLGNVTFYSGGAARPARATSVITLGSHAMTCSFLPLWQYSDIQKGQSPIMPSTSFGPCTVDGVLVGSLSLTELNTGIALTITLIDGKCFSMMLTNSAGVHLADLTQMGFKGPYKSNVSVGFNLLGTLN